MNTYTGRGRVGIFKRGLGNRPSQFVWGPNYWGKADCLVGSPSEKTSPRKKNLDEKWLFVLNTFIDWKIIGQDEKFKDKISQKVINERKMEMSDRQRGHSHSWAHPSPWNKEADAEQGADTGGEGGKCRLTLIILRKWMCAMSSSEWKREFWRKEASSVSSRFQIRGIYVSIPTRELKIR